MKSFGRIAAWGRTAARMSPAGLGLTGGLKSLLAWLGLVPGLSVCASAYAGEKPFDDIGYKLSTSFDVPMNSIAGLTQWARDINHVYALTTGILVFVFLAVSIPLIIAITKFRVKEEDLAGLKPPKQVHGNAILEFSWTIIPAILLLFIAVPTWEAIFSQPEKAPENALRVKVIGHQWWWEFQYPELGITTASELHLPANTPVFFEISSADVIHSFWIPQFGGKIDALPGKEAENHLFITTPALKQPGKKGGEYYQGQCLELCGLSHALMRFEAVVHAPDEFQRWATTHNEAPAVESELAKKGEQLFAQCQVCHTIAGTPSAEMEKQLLAMDPPAPKQGPNLSNFGNRRTLAAGTRLNTEQNFAAWVRNPQAVKPGATMLAFGQLTDAEVAALAAYLRHATAKTY